MHAWHDIKPTTSKKGVVKAVIEIPKGSKAKYELDKESGFLKMDRVLFSSVHYPTNYGFIPQSYCGDKDPLDILVISQIDIPSLCIVDARVLGVMRMVDQGEADDKIIAVAEHDVSLSHVQNLSDIPSYLMAEINRFFEDYKILENKKIKVEPFSGYDEAMAIIDESFQFYKENFSEK
jgi:inorganic pyrophosphatase